MSKLQSVAVIASLAACGGDGAPDVCDNPESGIACRWAGVGERGFNIENQDAHRLESKLYFPEDLTFAPDGRAYVMDWNNHRIRRVEADDTLTVVVGADYEGDGPPDQGDRLPAGDPAGAIGTTVAMNHPTDAMFGPDGRLYIAAWHNNKIRVYDPATDIVKVLAGDGYGFAGDGGPCHEALFNQPKAIAVGPDGSVYVNDQRNLRIRKISPEGIITTIAGTGVVGNAGDDGLALDTQLGFDSNPTPQPSGSLLLVGDMLYVADSTNHRIRKIDLVAGTIHAVAGDPNGASGYADGAAADARFNFPMDLEIGPGGQIYISDRYNNAVRALDPTTGAVTTVAGNGVPCPTASNCGELVDGLPALEMQLNEPYGIEFDAAGNLYIADTNNNQILKVTR
jgi:sugar lactone lactonase YvrE